MPGHGNEFKPYLRRLAELAKNDNINGSTKGLKGYCRAWRKASKNILFREAQLAESDETYYNPSQEIAKELGLRTPLARGQMYDAIIEHGGGDDYDSLGAMVSRTNAYFRSRGLPETPKQGLLEQSWLDRFLYVRKEDLCHPANKESQKVWCESVGRVDSYIFALKLGQSYFEQSLTALDNDGNPVTIGCNMNLAGSLRG
ncbi:hypothetical protein HDV00_006787 [Rhizophlyctis rosea]|nr:hypothetical protein HDV00_006787 [Rhizophlyctis rosea]